MMLSNSSLRIRRICKEMGLDCRLKCSRLQPRSLFLKSDDPAVEFIQSSYTEHWPYRRLPSPRINLSLSALSGWESHDLQPQPHLFYHSLIDVDGTSAAEKYYGARAKYFHYLKIESKSENCRFWKSSSNCSFFSAVIVPLPSTSDRYLALWTQGQQKSRELRDMRACQIDLIEWRPAFPETERFLRVDQVQKCLVALTRQGGQLAEINFMRVCFQPSYTLHDFEEHTSMGNSRLVNTRSFDPVLFFGRKQK